MHFELLLCSPLSDKAANANIKHYLELLGSCSSMIYDDVITYLLKKTQPIDNYGTMTSNTLFEMPIFTSLESKKETIHETKRVTCLCLPQTLCLHRHYP